MPCSIGEAWSRMWLGQFLLPSGSIRSRISFFMKSTPSDTKSYGAVAHPQKPRSTHNWNIHFNNEESRETEIGVPYIELYISI
jgi:hypothetical protein